MEIRLPVREPSGVRRRQWPVTQGVPFGRGELPVGQPVALYDDAGHAQPVQTRVLATWSAERAFVKWLLVDFLADLEPGATQVYRLGTVDEPEPVYPDNPVTALSGPDGISVDVGRLRLLVPRNEPGLRLTIPTRRDTSDGGIALGLRIRADDGVLYSADNAPPDSMEVEERGMLRSVVCLRGRLAEVDGNGRAFPYVLRISCFAGLPFCRVEHTFVFDQDPETTQLAEVSVVLGTVAPGELQEHRRGSTLVLTADGPVHGPTGTAMLLQHAADAGELLLDGHTSPRSGRTRGLAVVSSDDHEFGVAVREFWQQHPKAVSGDGKQITVGLVPAETPPLELRNPYVGGALRFDELPDLEEETFRRYLEEHPGVPLNLKSIGLGHRDFGMTDSEAGERVRRYLERYAADRAYCFCDTGGDSAFGMAKTHELWVRIVPEARGARDAEDWDAFSRCVEEPLSALPDSEYVCKTGVARLTHARDEERFPEIERAFEKLYRALVLEPQEVCGIDGMLDWGEMINGHTKSNQIIYRSYRQNPRGRRRAVDILGTFNNEAQDVIYQLWLLYLRTGRPEYLRFADAKSRHTEDVDFIHAVPNDRDPQGAGRLGLMHYHNVLNTSGGPSPSHSLVSGIMLHHYLTGSHRALEVARGVAENCLRRATAEGVVRGRGLHREVTGPLFSVMELYRKTWDPRYFRVMDETLRVLRAVKSSDGNLPVSLFTGEGPSGNEVWAEGVDNRTDYPGGMLFHILHDAFELYDEPWVGEWIIRLADSWLYDVRCDDYIPPERLSPKPGEPTESIRVQALPDGWYWRSFIDYSNNYFDPLVALAFHLTGDDRFLGYLEHRARIFPERAREAYECFTPETFNAINHWGDAVPAVLSALAGADSGRREGAYAEWKAERVCRGYPVYEGDRRGFSDDGVPRGTAMNVRVKAYGARDTTRVRLLP